MWATERSAAAYPLRSASAVGVLPYRSTASATCMRGGTRGGIALHYHREIVHGGMTSTLRGRAGCVSSPCTCWPPSCRSRPRITSSTSPAGYRRVESAGALETWRIRPVLSTGRRAGGRGWTGCYGTGQRGWTAERAVLAGSAEVGGGASYTASHGSDRIEGAFVLTPSKT